MRHDSDLPQGIRYTSSGFQSYRWRKDPTKPRGGYQASKRWPRHTSIPKMQAWQKEQELRGKRPDLFVEEVKEGSAFADRVREYLLTDKVQRMATKGERELHMHEWSVRFGHREPETIEPHEIQKALDELRSRMSGGTVNKRRTALMDFYTLTYGRHKANPVKGTTKYDETEPEPRAPAMANVLKMINAIPSDSDYAIKCRARLKVIAWTGWPHRQIKELKEGDLPHWKKGTAYIGRRWKGRGAAARWLPLLPEAVKALREFHTADAYGHFSNSPLRRKVKYTCRRLKIPYIRPYDLRHFFGTLIATLTQDERALKELMLVTSDKVIKRYTMAATNPRVQAAVAAIAQRLPGLLKAAQQRKNPAAMLPEKKNARKR